MGTHHTGLSRRKFLHTSALGLGAATLATPLLAACGSGSSGSTATGAVSSNGLAAVLPTYVPSTGGITPDFPSVAGAAGSASIPGYLHYPTTPVRTVAKTPGAGGTYNAITPLWGSIPPANNPYYQAVNKALGANMVINPANGNTYNNTIPTLVAGNKLPDWIMLPTWWNSTLNVGELAATKFADLTPYLSKDNIKQYPNLAAIPTGGWEAGAWEGKLFGIPSFVEGDPFAAALFYRKDIFTAKGINPDDIKTADDLYHLGGQLTAQTAGVWAFDVLWLTIQQMFNVPYLNNGFYVENGKLRSAFESPQAEEALAYAYKLAKSGYVHPDALADDTSNANQRFYSGKELVGSGGPGGWTVSDAQQGQAANPAYERGAFNLFSADGSTPTILLASSTGEVSYLNKSLSATQIQECLRIADYLAAPFGSAEFTLINYGVQGVDWTPSATGPTYTTVGQKEANQDTYQFLAAPQNVASNPGFDAVTRNHCAWSANAVKYATKPVFWNMNITTPSRFASVSTAQEVNDIIKQVTYGTKTVNDYKATVASWKSAGGDAMVSWYQTNVMDKYGTGQ